MQDLNDVWEYDEELSGLGTQSATVTAAMKRSSSTGASGKGVYATGIWEQKSNSTCIIVEVTPKKITEQYIMPLYVNFTFTETPEEDDFSVEDEGEESDGSGKLVLKKANRDGFSDVSEEGILRQLDFWVSIGLGKVSTGFLTTGAEMIGF